MARQSNDPAQFLNNLFESGQDLMRQFAQMGAAGTANPAQERAAETKAEPATDFIAASRKLAELQQGYFKQMSNYMTGIFGVAASARDEDKRFSAEAWANDPRFDVLKRTYIAYSGFLKNAVETAPMDDQGKVQLRFAVGQFIDAMSPTNFLATNPEALQLAQETGGQSLVEGMNLYFQDLAKGRISMSDESAFEVGRNVAATEGEVVFENELIQLIQYTPKTAQVYERPLVMIPPCINKFYVLDLQKENSFVRYAVEQGHTVFLVSWRSITPELGHLTWDDYITTGVIKALDVAREITGVKKVNTLGFCVGGTLLSSTLAVLAAKAKQKATSMTLLTTLLDFSDTGELGNLVSEESVKAREATLGRGGVLEGKDLALVFSMLRSSDLIWQYVANSYLKGKSAPAFDMLYWNADSANLPGPMYCWYIRNTYLENNLKKPGKTIQCGVPVDLGKINLPAFLYASRDDHIVPWGSAYAATQLLTGDNVFALGASGHIAGVINAPAKKKRNYWIGGKLDRDAAGWLETAQSIPGSWWTAWSEWLAPHAGGKVPARTPLGNEKYRPIEPALGRYVRQKA